MANKDYDKLVTLRISNYQGSIIASSGNEQLGVAYIDLNGFAFLQFTILSATSVKTMKGCTVKLISRLNEKEVVSDTEEIEADFSRELNTGIFDFDIDLEDEILGFIIDNEIDTIQISFEKNSFEFKNIDHSLLLKVITKEFQETMQDEEE
jgi:hypothetical protein